MINPIGDFSNLRVYCKKIYSLKNVNEISKIIKYANTKKLKLVPIGGGTGTSGGYFGEADIGINFKKLSQYHKNNGIFTVGAGLKVGLFNKYLKEFDLTVPMTEAPGASIGGSIAMDNPGKPYHHYGLAEYLKSITLVLPSGEIKKINKKSKILFYSTIGGEGMTGIIAEAEFKPIKIQNKYAINILFKANDFDFLESFWNKIVLVSRRNNLKISRGVVFPLGMLQIRVIFTEERVGAINNFESKIDKVLLSYPNVRKFNSNIPIGEMIIDQLAKKLNVQFKFFPAISQTNYKDKKFHAVLASYINKNRDISFIKEINIGPMRYIGGSPHVFNGRIPDFTSIKKKNNSKGDVYILNYGGSNVCGGGSHIAFMGNDLEKIKYHMKNIFRVLHKKFPKAIVIEHKASIIRGEQVKFMEGMNGLKLRRRLRNKLDPNKVMHTGAIQNIDEAIFNL